MSNFEFPPKKETPAVAYSETTMRVLITEIIPKKDKNQNDFWIIKTQLDGWNVGNYLAFSNNLSQKTVHLLLNPEQIINQFATLTIRKKADREKVIGIDLAN